MAAAAGVGSDSIWYAPSNVNNDMHAADASRQPLAVADYEALVGFPLDPFQAEAVEAYLRGHSVLVAAPTGTGKTAIAELAVLDALRRGGRAIYTTPIKALSNQKLRDFRKLLERGAERGLIDPGREAGLLTGDIVLNQDATCSS